MDVSKITVLIWANLYSHFLYSKHFRDMELCCSQSNNDINSTRIQGFVFERMAGEHLKLQKAPQATRDYKQDKRSLTNSNRIKSTRVFSYTCYQTKICTQNISYKKKEVGDHFYSSNGQSVELVPGSGARKSLWLERRWKHQPP